MYKRPIAMAIVALAATLAAASANADSYKCYVIGHNDAPHIVFTQTDKVESSKALAATMHITKGKVKIAVKEVVECKLEAERFSTAAARKLDDATPR